MKLLLKKDERRDIIKGMESEIIKTYPSGVSDRYPVTQEQINDILENELKNFKFPVKPIYNPRIYANGITKGEIYPWGELKRIKSIEIGKQDNPNKKFLIDTLIHEYYEAEIMKNQYVDEFYRELSKAGEIKRHKWIEIQIAKFFTETEG